MQGPATEAPTRRGFRELGIEEDRLRYDQLAKVILTRPNLQRGSGRIENACGGITGRSPSSGDHPSSLADEEARLAIPFPCACGAVFKRFWEYLGPLGSIFGCLGAVLGALGSSWDALGGVLGDLGAILR